MLKTNKDRIAKFKVQGKIMPPYGGGWRVCYDGVHRMVPSVGGITLNFKVGDLANAMVADHLEPGVSTSMETGSDMKPRSIHNSGYNNYSCVGSDAIVISGDAKGAKGVVTGHHGGCEHVIIDFDDETLERLTQDDKIVVVSHGVGLEIEGLEQVKIFSTDIRLFESMKLRSLRNGRLEVPVAAVVPAVVMGSGLGSSEPFHGDYDIQTSDADSNKKYGLGRLRLGDLVAVMDHDSSQGWSYCQGAVSIGVIIHGDSHVAGHGPGCQTLMTSKEGLIVPKVDHDANIGALLGIGRWRTAKSGTTGKRTARTKE